MSALIPRQPVPALTVDITDGGSWTLSEQQPQRFTMIVFYRGLHCPVCKAYLRELDRLADEFTQRGVEVIAISSDSAERGQQVKADWGLRNLNIGYEMSIEKAREWGLFVSTSRGKTSIGIEEPALFSEPGIFIVRSDGTLYYSAVQSMPFARPHFDELLKAIDFAIDKNYPARGEA